MPLKVLVFGILAVLHSSIVPNSGWAILKKIGLPVTWRQRQDCTHGSKIGQSTGFRIVGDSSGNLASFIQSTSWHTLVNLILCSSLTDCLSLEMLPCLSANINCTNTVRCRSSGCHQGDHSCQVKGIFGSRCSMPAACTVCGPETCGIFGYTANTLPNKIHTLTHR